MCKRKMVYNSKTIKNRIKTAILLGCVLLIILAGIAVLIVKLVLGKEPPGEDEIPDRNTFPTNPIVKCRVIKPRNIDIESNYIGCSASNILQQFRSSSYCRDVKGGNNCVFSSTDLGGMINNTVNLVIIYDDRDSTCQNGFFREKVCTEDQVSCVLDPYPEWCKWNQNQTAPSLKNVLNNDSNIARWVGVPPPTIPPGEKSVMFLGDTFNSMLWWKGKDIEGEIPEIITDSAILNDYKLPNAIESQEYLDNENKTVDLDPMQNSMATPKTSRFSVEFCSPFLNTPEALDDWYTFRGYNCGKPENCTDTTCTIDGIYNCEGKEGDTVVQVENIKDPGYVNADADETDLINNTFVGDPTSPDITPESTPTAESFKFRLADDPGTAYTDLLGNFRCSSWVVTGTDGEKQLQDAVTTGGQEDMTFTDITKDENRTASCRAASPVAVPPVVGKMLLSQITGERALLKTPEENLNTMTLYTIYEFQDTGLSMISGIDMWMLGAYKESPIVPSNNDTSDKIIPISQYAAVVLMLVDNMNPEWESDYGGNADRGGKVRAALVYPSAVINSNPTDLKIVPSGACTTAEVLFDPRTVNQCYSVYGDIPTAIGGESCYKTDGDRRIVTNGGNLVKDYKRTRGVKVETGNGNIGLDTTIPLITLGTSRGEGVEDSIKAKFSTTPPGNNPGGEAGQRVDLIEYEKSTINSGSSPYQPVTRSIGTDSQENDPFRGYVPKKGWRLIMGFVYTGKDEYVTLTGDNTTRYKLPKRINFGCHGYSCDIRLCENNKTTCQETIDDSNGKPTSSGEKVYPKGSHQRCNCIVGS